MVKQSVSLLAKAASVKEAGVPNKALDSIDILTQSHASNYELLAAEMRDMQAQIDGIKNAHLPAIRALVVRTKASHAVLSDAIMANVAVFESPRTRQMHGFKVGIRKQVGSMVFIDQEKAIKLVEKMLPELAETVIDVKKSINKAAAGQLSARDLKSIGGEITDPVDEVVIKPTAGDVEKLVNALIDEKGME